jgi:transcriptional regulator with XRE-family HTH domain
MVDQVWSGKDLQYWRSMLGWSQRQAAEELGVAERTYGNLERSEELDRRTMLACLYLQQEKGAAESLLATQANGLEPLLEAVAADIAAGGVVAQAIRSMFPIVGDVD